MTRIRLIRNLEEKRGSRVITLVHRQESISFLGIPLSRYINIEDSEQVLRAIRMTPREMPIDIILHTPGGLVLASEQIAYALKNHPAKVTVFVPHYAMSGGTLIALAADEIVMDANAVLGPVDPQISGYPAASLVKEIKERIIGDKITDPKQIRDIIIEVAGDLNINITQEHIDQLADLMDRISKLDLSVEKISGQLENISKSLDKVRETINENKGLIQKILDAIKSFFAWLADLFRG